MVNYINVTDWLNQGYDPNERTCSINGYQQTVKSLFLKKLCHFFLLLNVNVAFK